MIVSPIADRLVSRAVSARGAAAPPTLPAAPRPHSSAVTAITEQSVRHVAAKLCRVAARLGAAWIAVQQRFEEVQLSKAVRLHGPTIPWSAPPCPTANFPRATIPQATK